MYNFTLPHMSYLLHQNQNIFFKQHWESEYFFRKKNITPPLQVKWSFPKHIGFIGFDKTCVVE
jgi:hypothetical protein